MAMTFAEMVTYTKRHLDMELSDSDDPKAPDSLIQAMLNFGQVETVRRLSNCFFRKAVVIDATAGMIDLPTDFLCGLIVKYKAAGQDTWRKLNVTPILSLDEKWLDVSSTTGEVQLATLNSGAAGEIQLQLYPALTGTVTDGLALSYNWKPTDLVEATDTSAITGMFPDVEPVLLPAFAAWHIKLFENGVEDDQVAKWQGVYESSLQRVRKAIDLLMVGNSTWAGR